jgi:hypothetical protein
MTRWFVSLLAFVAALVPVPAGAEPARIIILRHGEKHDAYRLCPTGAQRAQGLAA